MATKTADQWATKAEENEKVEVDVIKQTNRKRNIPRQQDSFEKQQKQEGLSWWTCLLLDIPQESREGLKVSVFHKEE